MKQIIRNSYVKTFKFTSLQEMSAFVSNQGVKNHLSIDDILGNNYYCYVGYHSLTKEKQFILSFSSDESDDNLNFLFCDNLFVLDTGTNIYLIDESLSIKVSLEITTPLIGLYLINNEKLLILEEAYMRVMDYKGEIVKSELFDLIEDFSVKDNLLFIRTSEENKVIEFT